MDFTLDADQLALRDVARQALDAEVDGALVRRLADDPIGVDEALWRQFVELGWTGLLVPSPLGGAGAGLVEMGIVLEQMGRVPVPGPFFSSAVAATLAARALGAEELLGELASGERRGTVAVQELGHGDPLHTVRSRARRKGAGWVVSGEKALVVDGQSADWVIVVARGEDGVRSFLLEHPEVESVPTLDPTRKGARLVLNEQPVVPLGPGGNQADLWRRILDDIAVSLAAETVGTADRALQMAIDYTSHREVFGQPIAQFQVAKHKMVDMFQLLEMARVGVQYAAWASDVDAPDRERAVAMAASFASEAGIKVTGDDIQLHGGVGFTWANDSHFLFKRAKQNEVLLGGGAFERQRLAQMLVESA